MRELKIDEILNREVIITYPDEKIKELKEFVNFKPIIAEDDYLGRWRQEIVEWLLEPFDVGK